MNTVSTRPAVDEDFDQIVKVEQQSYPEPWTLKHFKDEMEKGYSRVLVLTDDETDSLILGYIVYWVQAEGASLLNVTVTPSWRNLGFAKRLMYVMINEIVRDEIPKIVLEVRSTNTSAIKLYERIGFQKTHERKNFYSNGETALVMELKTSELSGVIQ